MYKADDKAPKHIHLIGICGTAMASLAGMLQAAGAPGDGVGCGGVSADERSACGDGDSGLAALCGENLEPRPDLVWWAMRSRAGMSSWSMCSMSADSVYVRWRRCCMMSFCLGASRWWWRGRMARRLRRACWRGFMRWPRERMEFAPSFLIGGVAENFGTSFMVRPVSRRPFAFSGGR
jgi:UDP-N-acetylmuramate: L-alanyl-gamma-D-glutamyl-meso-diaminopimelate ligase